MNTTAQLSEEAALKTVPEPLKRVIGIGASAGGLDGFLSLFSALPVIPDTAVIIAQHMARDEHAQLVLSLLNREGLWPAQIPKTGTPLQGGHLYLLPAEKDGVVQDGLLMLETPFNDSYSSPSVNRLFRSLSDQYGARLLGVVLSGAGSDGASGCRAIKQAGGEVWLQSPTEAAYNSMPLSAADAVKPDFVGTIAELAHELHQLAHAADSSRILETPLMGKDQTHLISAVKAQNNALIGKSRSDSIALQSDSKAHQSDKALGLSPCDEENFGELEQVTALIFEHTGIDFAGYKRETLLRRLEKRKSQVISKVGNKSTQPEYLDYLQQHPSELEILEQCLLVSVSSFFRDAEVFQCLKPTIAAQVTHKRDQIALGKDSAVFRILVAGCATGEEAYSLAMLCRQLDLTIPVEITAVDLNREALHIAEKGRYPAKKVTELPGEMLNRYFDRLGDEYQVKNLLKEKVRFIQGDIFTKYSDHLFDLVSCRNLMIYLKREQQDELVAHLHEQMKANSTLVIGLTESLSPVGQQLFSTTDYFHRIFRRRKTD